MSGHEDAAEGDPRGNHILASLPEAEWDLLKDRARIVLLKHGAQVFSGGESEDVSYFPLTSIISMISEMANGDESEYGCIGCEGMLGLHVALGAQPLRGQALCQLEGTAVRLDGFILRTVTASGKAPVLQRLLLRYAQATINTLAQASSCNALHNVRQRTARWLLASRDRAGSETFSLTQEFLARMLGVRRASVTEVALSLQESKLIEYHRGTITVVDNGGLEAAACECYPMMRDEYRLVYEPRPARP